jgi:anaerobic magnesium-protoporphyrin IX monomethyl ester cyclase
MLMTGRGCPYDCQFCGAPQLYSRKVRLFPMDMVKEIMEQHRRIFGSNQCRVMDDTFAISSKRVQEFCDMVGTNFGPNRMSCLTHCQTADLDTMKLMKQTGFDIVAYGIESGNDEVLKLINKGTTVEQSAKAVQIARQAGLDVEALFMIGLIGDTESSINDTIEFAVKHNHPSQYNRQAAWNWFQFATPFPGSRFFNEADKHGTVLTRNYDEYHHQKPVFVPTGLTPEKMIELRTRAFAEAK